MPSSNNVKVEVTLTDAERGELERLVAAHNVPAAKARRAKVLLLADEDRRLGRRPDWFIVEKTGLSKRQVVRIRQRFAAEGLEATLGRRPRIRPGTTPKFDAPAEARLVALACSEPPEGRQRWTLKLLADEAGRLGIVTSVCPETVRRCLKKTGSSLGPRGGSASPTATGPASSPTWKASSTSTPAAPSPTSR